MINFDTDRLVILAYTSGAGGKFLANCLGISMGAELQHASLLDKFNNSEQKFNLLYNIILSNPYFWSDCNLGCGQLLGIPNPAAVERTVPTDILKSCYSQSLTLPRLTNGKNLFFLVAHNLYELQNYLSIWKNAKIIRFVNEKKWVFRRYDSLVTPGCEQDLESNQATIDHLVDPLRVMEFDTSWYFDTDQTAQQVQMFYEKLELNDFNKVYIQKLHRAWTNTLDEIKRNSLKNHNSYCY